MNTDASSVEDINIPKINVCFCLVLHLLRIGPASFALDHSPCARMLVILNDMSDSVTVSESISSSSTKNPSVCCVTNRVVVHLQVSPFLLPTFHQICTREKTTVRQYSTLSNLMSKRPKQVSLLFDAAHSTSSEVLPDFQIWFSPGLSDAVEASTFGSLALYRETKFIIGFDFAGTLSSLASFCVLFDITSYQLVELIWLMFNKHKSLFHSSRVKFPFVSMSASWFLVSMYLIWISGPKPTQPNNQSRATLWVLETCLIVRPLRFMIILITASLSSNTNNEASRREELTFEETKSTLSGSSIIP